MCVSVGTADVELLVSVACDLVDGVSTKANCLCATGQLVTLWVIRASMFSFLKILVIFLSNLSEINRISN